MQLLNTWVLNVVLTALITSTIISLFLTLAMWLHAKGQKNVWSVFWAVLSFSSFGFVTGFLMGSNVSTVLPAVLTLLGGVAVYVVGSKGTEAQATVSGLVMCFAVTLFAGSLFGLQLQVEYNSQLNDPARLRQQALALEANREALEVQRLLDYIQVLKLKQGLADQNKLDLSKFSITYESPSENQSAAAK